jgi:hypothetical protein
MAEHTMSACPDVDGGAEQVHKDGRGRGALSSENLAPSVEERDEWDVLVAGVARMGKSGTRWSSAARIQRSCI